MVVEVFSVCVCVGARERIGQQKESRDHVGSFGRVGVFVFFGTDSS